MWQFTSLFPKFKSSLLLKRVLLLNAFATEILDLIAHVSLGIKP